MAAMAATESTALQVVLAVLEGPADFFLATAATAEPVGERRRRPVPAEMGAQVVTPGCWGGVTAAPAAMAVMGVRVAQAESVELVVALD